MRLFYENKGDSVQVTYGKSLAFGAHLHNHIELVYMTQGTAQTFVDSEEYLIAAGDVFLVFPNQVHQYRRLGEEAYLLAIFPPGICPEFQWIFQRQVPVSPVIHLDLEKAARNHVYNLLVRLEEVNREENTPFRETLLKGYFLALLSELLQCTELKTAPSGAGNETMRDILNYCQRHYTRDIQLVSLAEAVHMNEHYISHLFHKKLHMGFRTYINMLRVSEACQYLLCDEKRDVTDIAYAVGFNSIRSFNRAFKEYAGVTPVEYRKGRGPSFPNAYPFFSREENRGQQELT